MAFLKQKFTLAFLVVDQVPSFIALILRTSIPFKLYYTYKGLTVEGLIRIVNLYTMAPKVCKVLSLRDNRHGTNKRY